MVVVGVLRSQPFHDNIAVAGVVVVVVVAGEKKKATLVVVAVVFPVGVWPLLWTRTALAAAARPAFFLWWVSLSFPP